MIDQKVSQDLLGREDQRNVEEKGRTELGGGRRRCEKVPDGVHADPGLLTDVIHDGRYQSLQIVVQLATVVSGGVQDPQRQLQRHIQLENIFEIDGRLRVQAIAGSTGTGSRFLEFAQQRFESLPGGYEERLWCRHQIVEQTVEYAPVALSGSQRIPEEAVQGLQVVLHVEVVIAEFGEGRECRPVDLLLIEVIRPRRGRVLIAAEGVRCTGTAL